MGGMRWSGGEEKKEGDDFERKRGGGCTLC